MSKTAFFSSAHPAISLEPVQVFQEMLRTGIDVEELLHDNHHSTVFKGAYPVRGKPIELALKFCFGTQGAEEQLQEYNHYDALHCIQGNVILVCYGLLALRKDRFVVSCLMTEFCGILVNVPFIRLPRATKVEILEKLSIIHKKGFSRHNFRENNIILRKSNNNSAPDVWIIDLYSLKKHECKMNYDFTKPQEFFQDDGSETCHEIIEIADETHFWTWGLLWVGGDNAIDKSPDLPDQNTVRDLAPGWVSPSRQQTKCLEIYYREIKQEMDSGKTIEQLRPSVNERYERIVENRYLEALANGESVGAFKSPSCFLNFSFRLSSGEFVGVAERTMGLQEVASGP